MRHPPAPATGSERTPSCGTAASRPASTRPAPVHRPCASAAMRSARGGAARPSARSCRSCSISDQSEASACGTGSAAAAIQSSKRTVAPCTSPTPMRNADSLRGSGHRGVRDGLPRRSPSPRHRPGSSRSLPAARASSAASSRCRRTGGAAWPSPSGSAAPPAGGRRETRPASASPRCTAPMRCAHSR